MSTHVLRNRFSAFGDYAELCYELSAACINIKSMETDDTPAISEEYQAQVERACIAASSIKERIEYEIKQTEPLSDVKGLDGLNAGFFVNDFIESVKRDFWEPVLRFMGCNNIRDNQVIESFITRHNIRKVEVCNTKHTGWVLAAFQNRGWEITRIFYNLGKGKLENITFTLEIVNE